MNSSSVALSVVLCLAASSLASPAQPAQSRQARVQSIDLDSARFSEIINGTVEPTNYRGRRALRLAPSAGAANDADMLAILDRPKFSDGTITVDVAGSPRAGAPPDSRGFVGVAFRTGEHGEWSEIFYLRPTNGRADDQLRRNHSTQYVAPPDYPWQRLRQESPGVYESYVDLESGAWTRMTIEVSGKTARLFVNGASQPCLVINDLKRADTAGRVALWAHVQTNAYFGRVTIENR